MEAAVSYDPKLTGEIARRIRLRLGHVRIVLFGSRADGTATDRSDYDIGIDAGGKLPDAALADIRAEMERLPTLHTVDVVDLNAVGENFASVVLERSVEL